MTSARSIEYTNNTVVSIRGAVKGKKRSKKTVHIGDAPDTAAPVADPGGEIDGERATIKIPALSRNDIRFVRP